MKFQVKLNETYFELESEPFDLANSIIKHLEIDRSRYKFKLRYFDNTTNQYNDLQDFKQLNDSSKIEIKLEESNLVEKDLAESIDFNLDEPLENSSNYTNQYQIDEETEVKQKYLELVKSLADLKKADSIHHHYGLICDKCDQSNIITDRYHCLECKNFDLCGECFEKRLVCENHQLGHLMIRFQAPYEIFGKNFLNEKMSLDELEKIYSLDIWDVICTICHNKIIGLRIKCDQCISYDMCKKCFMSKKMINDHNIKHSVLLFNRFRNLKSADLYKIEEMKSNNINVKIWKVKYLPLDKIVIQKQVTKPRNIFLNELSNYDELNSNYIVKLFGYFTEETGENENTTFNLVFEYMEKESLDKVLRNEFDTFSLKTRLLIITNIGSALRRIHEKNFVHLNIRPDNILVDSNNLAKLGASRSKDDTYLPKDFNKDIVSKKFDIYSFGLTINEILTGKKHSIENGNVKLPEESKILFGLIRQCLNENPAQRPTAQYIDEKLTLYSKILLHSFNHIEQSTNQTRENVNTAVIDIISSLENRLEEEKTLLNNFIEANTKIISENLRPLFCST